MTRLRKAARATLVAQTFNWIALGLSLITVPLYLSWLGQERYGVLLTGLAFASYLMFSDAGLNWASMLLIAQASGEDDHAKIASIVRNSFSLAACSGLLVIVMVAGLQWLLISPATMGWLPAHPEFPGLLLAIGASVLCSLAISPFYNLLSGLQDGHLAAAYQGGGRLLGTILAMGMAYTRAPLGWVFAGNVAGVLVAGLCASAHSRRRHSWAFGSGSWWDPSQIRQQLRTGAKSFVMQAGNVLYGTAPVLTISAAAGPQFVPYYSIPLSLLNAPLGILNSFGASLQAGYGEAMSRGEKHWIGTTVRKLFRQVLFLLGLLGCGFILLAAPFIQLWTGGRIEPSDGMLAGVLAIASAQVLMSQLRYALTGINRHRQAAVGDLICGVLSILFGIFLVGRFGYEAIGLSMVTAVCMTSGWLLPRELRRALDDVPVVPALSFWMRWTLIILMTFIAGSLVAHWADAIPAWVAIVTSGAVITGAFFCLGWLLLPGELQLAKRFLPARWRRTAPART